MKYLTVFILSFLIFSCSETNTDKSDTTVVNDTVVSIATSQFRTLILQKDGTLLACGNNGATNLLIPDKEYIEALTPVYENVKQISTGGVAMYSGDSLLYHYFTYIITIGDSLLMCGANNAYEDFGFSEVYTSPTFICSDVKNVSAGKSHTAILKNDNTLWTYGYNDFGQLGDSTTTLSYNPIKVAEDVKQVYSGPSKTFYIKNDLTLWGMGQGFQNNGTKYPFQIMDSVKAVSCGQDHTLFLKSDNSLWALGGNSYGQWTTGTTSNFISYMPLKVMDNVKSFDAGWYYSLVIKENNSLWAYGHDFTGNPSPTPRLISTNVAQAYAGATHMVFIKQDGTVWACGNNDSGQLGDGTFVDSDIPVQIR